MRALILIAGAAVSLAACGNNDQAENTVNADQALTANSISTNDVTAIDAITGEAANMAADVDIAFTNDMLDPPGNSAGGRARPRAPGADSTDRPGRPRAPAPRPAADEQPAPANSASNSTE
jgi:hypothetical protein